MTELASRARLAILWTTGFQVFRDALQFGLMLVLVRLLPPEAYGTFGLTTTLLSFLTLYSFRSFLTYALQVRREEDANFQGHFTAGAVIQLILFVVANGIAFGLRWLPSHAAVAPLLHVMSVLFLLDLPSELRVKMLERQLDWRRLRGLHAFALLLSGSLSVLLAGAGWGVYALLLPLLVVPVPFVYDLFVVKGWRPTWEWEWRSYRGAWMFGWARISGTSFVSVAVLLESAWLTGVVGFAAYGIYGRALGLTQLACDRTSTLVSTSVYPVLTKIGPRTDAYRRASALLLRAIAWAVVPVAVIGALLADEVVAILYGSAWTEVATLLPWALAAGAVVAVVQPAYTLLLAHERQDRCLVADVWRLVGTVLTLSLALPLGLQTYLAGLTAVHVVSLFLVLYWLRSDDAIAAEGVLMALVPPLVAAGSGAGALFAARFVTPIDDSWWSVAFEAAVFGCVYLGAIRLLYPRQLQELVGYLPERDRLSRWLLLANPA